MPALGTPSATQVLRSVNGGPAWDLSVLYRIDRPTPIDGFAIKYVVQGREHYTVDGADYAVDPGRYLLANASSVCHARIEDTRPVIGLCIDLPTAVLDEVVHGWTCPEAFADEADASFFTGPEFLESVRDSRYTALGPLLQRMAAGVIAEPHDPRYRTAELAYALAEGVVRDHVRIVPRLRAIGAVRSTTRKDIYRRVQRAKAFMDAELFRSRSVAEIACVAAMSPYHFLRAFQRIEGLSPYQYRLQRRLEAAHAMLAQGHSSVHEAALCSGFADLPSFSKAFRKRYGHPPSHLLRGSRRN